MLTSSFSPNPGFRQNLRAAEEQEGLFSSFALLPSGEVIYFDGGGSPYRVNLKGRALLQGTLLDLAAQPVKLISPGEALEALAGSAQNLYLGQARDARIKKLNWKQNGLRHSIYWLASAVTLLFIIGVISVALNPAPAEKIPVLPNSQLNPVIISKIELNPRAVNPFVTTYNPLGPATISSEGFNRFLREINSPALSEGNAMYQTCLEEGCDPALLLAFFEHESGGGLNGVAASTKSVGNIRCSPGYACYSTAGNGSFRLYPSWSEGARDWARLLKFYKEDWNRATLEEIIPKYAPQADDNNEAAYITAVKNRVDNLRRREKNPL